MNKLILSNKDKIHSLCKQHSVAELYAFGSVLTEKFNKQSDIDLLIDFKKMDLLSYFDNYMELKEKLEDLFGRNVDLVENKAIKNPIFLNIINRSKEKIYDGNNN